jgi:hypothetical protein
MLLKRVHIGAEQAWRKWRLSFVAAGRPFCTEHAGDTFPSLPRAKKSQQLDHLKFPVQLTC